MNHYRKVFWNEETQRIKWTENVTFDGFVNYQYVGYSTRAELDLLIEVLWELFDEDEITLEQFEMVFGDVRTFCDRLKKLVEES